MAEISIINKEIDETIINITNQHQQIKYYFQIYTASLVGLFTISGYFAKNGFTVDESIIGISFVITVFFLGWIFLSVTSHKVSMIILLYKHIAIFRERRLNILNCSGTTKDYVFPYGKDNVFMPGMLKFLPYIVFAFNFLILCGGLAFYLDTHLSYHQLVATVSAVTIFFGAFYPRVCITFNKHIYCAIKANTLKAKYNKEIAWEKLIKQGGKLKNIKNYVIVFLCIGSIILAILSFYTINPNYQFLIIISCWIGVVFFAIFRYLTEVYSLNIAKNKLNGIA